MSNPIDDGGPAFPNPPKEFWYGTSRIESFDKVGGMTLRDWLAGQWLAGLGANPNASDEISEIATGCYDMADAMLAARKEAK